MSLLCGRILIGIVAGINTIIVPMYFAEISPRRYRHILGAAHQLGITVGILVANIITMPSFGLLGTERTWRSVFLVPILCAAFECLVLPFCPESPVAIYRRSGSSEAVQRLAELHAAGSINQHIDQIRGQTATHIGDVRSLAAALLHASLPARCTSPVCCCV